MTIEKITEEDRSFLSEDRSMLEDPEDDHLPETSETSSRRSLYAHVSHEPSESMENNRYFIYRHPILEGDTPDGWGAD